MRDLVIDALFARRVDVNLLKSRPWTQFHQIRGRLRTMNI